MPARRVSEAVQRKMAQAAFEWNAPQAVVLSGLPMPPSANNIFANVPGRGRVKSDRYRTWKQAAGWCVKAQINGARIRGPVALTYTIEDGGSRADLGNLEKALTDLLVELNVIDGDGPKTVRSIKLQWGAVTGACVRVDRVPRLEVVA